MLNLKLDLDQEKQAEFISLGYFTNGKTAWKGLYKLQPAESLSYDLKNHTKLLKRYCHLFFKVVYTIKLTFYLTYKNTNFQSINNIFFVENGNRIWANFLLREVGDTLN